SINVGPSADITTSAASSTPSVPSTSEEPRDTILGTKAAPLDWIFILRQPVLPLLLLITLKKDPWWVFMVPRFPLGPACFHAPLVGVSRGYNCGSARENL
ncbi:hypothetical protein XENORESO_017718, partial [Xenotaenia resolanae]